MIEDLKNKVVLITGASTGIGAAAAIAFGKNGAKVAVHYNKSKAEAEKVAAQVEKAGGRAMLVGGDVTQSAVCREIVDKAVAGYGRIDVLINNAGGLVQRAPIETITDQLFDEVVNLNVRSAMICTSAAAQYMRNQCNFGRRSPWRRAGRIALRRLQRFCQHHHAWTGQGTGQGQDSRQRGCTRGHYDSLPRPLLDAANARRLQGHHSDESPGHRG